MVGKALETAKAEVERLRLELIAAQKHLHELECEAAGVKVGDVVLYKGVEHRVTKVETWTKPPWLQGNPKTKDGSFGKREVRMYRDWVKP